MEESAEPNAGRRLIYEVRSIAKATGKQHFWGAYRSPEEAHVALTERSTGAKAAWADMHHRTWSIEEIDTTGGFEIPSRPMPRDRFTVNVRRTSEEGEWNKCHVEILDGEDVVAQYDRNHAFYDTFEPFRRGDLYFALIAPDYTASSVIDLQTGEIVAGEEPSPDGFCPVGFYVPDWWDVHDDSVLPGSHYWNRWNEQPVGDFGFVWGCVWADTSDWKVQYLDLSRIEDGILVREERFGYLPIDTNRKTKPEIIRVWNNRAEFSVVTNFDLATGKPKPFRT